MPSVSHFGSKLQVIFVEEDDEGNAVREVPVTLSTRVFSFAAYLELFRQAWEQRNDVRKSCGLPPLPYPEAYRRALLAEMAEEKESSGDRVAERVTENGALAAGER